VDYLHDASYSILGVSRQETDFFFLSSKNPDTGKMAEPSTKGRPSYENLEKGISRWH